MSDAQIAKGAQSQERTIAIATVVIIVTITVIAATKNTFKLRSKAQIKGPALTQGPLYFLLAEQ